MSMGRICSSPAFVSKGVDCDWLMFCCSLALSLEWRVCVCAVACTTDVTATARPVTKGMTCPVESISYTPETEFHLRVNSMPTMHQIAISKGRPVSALLMINFKEAFAI